MEWPQLIIALIVVAAYVIKHIVSAQQEAAARREDQPAPAVPAKSDEEVARERTALDRRIEEAIERRRDMEESPHPVPKAIPMPPLVVAVPRYQPSTIGRPTPDIKPAPRSELPRPGLPRVVRPTPPQPVPLPIAVPVAPAAAGTPPVVIPVVTPVTTKTASPVVRQVLDLLQDRRSLAAAFVLREILDRPASQRRRRA